MQSDMGSVSRTPAAAAASSPAAPDPFSFPVLSSALEDAACAKELASFRLAPIRHPVTDLALTPSSVSTTPPGAVPEMPYAASAALSAVRRLWRRCRLRLVSSMTALHRLLAVARWTFQSRGGREWRPPGLPPTTGG